MVNTGFKGTSIDRSFTSLYLPLNDHYTIGIAEILTVTQLHFT